MCYPANKAALANHAADIAATATHREHVVAMIDAQFNDHYATLKRIAQSRIHRDGCGATLDSASIVNDCYVKLRESNTEISGDHAAFLDYASRTMRSVIIDSLRRETTQRRGGDCHFVAIETIDESAQPINAPDRDPELACDIQTAIHALARKRPRLAQIVASIYQRDATVAELASAFSLNERTIRRECIEARETLAMALA